MSRPGKVRILEAIVAPWAITPDMYEVIRDVYDRRVVQGERLSTEEIKGLIGVYDDEDDDRPTPPKPGKPYRMYGRIAEVPLIGVMSKRMNLFMQISGGTSTELARAAVKQAEADPEVDAILLHVDSPGGAVDGTQELAQAAFQARKKKPVYTFADGLMASGGMWVGAAGQKIYLSSGTANAGSIGVVASHVDRSKLDESMGIKRTEIVAGKYKRIVSENTPLSKDGREWLQDRVNTIYSVFVSDIAAFREVSVEKVLSEMAEGQIFIGQEAVDVGLADGIKSFEEVIEELNEKTKNSNRGGGPSLSNQEEAMTLAEMKEKDPQGYSKLVAEAKESVRAEVDKELGESKAAMEKQIETLTADTREQAKQIAILQAENKKKDTERVAKDNKIHVEKLADEILSESAIPEEMYAKVKAMPAVDHRKFVKEGEVFSPGSDAEKSFVAAFKAEVADWEAKLPKGAGIGLGEEKRDAGAEKEISQDHDYGRNLAKRVIGKIRSDG